MGSLVPVAAVTGVQAALNKYSNMQMINLQKNAQSELQREQNEFQAAENEKDRTWQEKTWLEHFISENEEYAKRLGLQQGQWQKQFDVTNAYNAPSAQMARLMAAGINPSAMMSGSSVSSLGQSSAVPSSSSASAQPNTSVPSSHGVSPASSPSFGGLSSAAAGFTSVAQMADAIGKLKQVGLNTERQAALLPSEVEQAAADAHMKQQKALLSEIETNVANAWMDKKAAAEFNKLVADSYAAYCSGDLAKANELLSSANERLVSLEGEIKAEQRPQLLANLKELQEVYRTEERKNKAQAVAANASAGQSYSVAEYNKEISETERKLREGKVTAQILSNAISRTENALLKRENLRDIQTNEWKIWKILNECKREGYATSEQLERWRIAVKDNNSYELRMILQEINEGIPSVVVPIK